MVDTASRAIELNFGDLAIASVLVVVAGMVSFIMRARLERDLGIAAVRTVVQLLLVGYVLKWVFGLANAYAVIGVAIVMIAAASRAAIRRPSRTLARPTRPI